MEKKFVIAGSHGPVPREDNPRRFIGAEPFEVPMTAYYLRRMAGEELVEFVPTEQPADKTKKGGK